MCGLVDRESFDMQSVAARWLFAVKKLANGVRGLHIDARVVQQVLRQH